MHKKQLITQKNREVLILRLTLNSNRLTKVQDAYFWEKLPVLLVMKLIFMWLVNGSRLIQKMILNNKIWPLLLKNVT